MRLNSQEDAEREVEHSLKWWQSMYQGEFDPLEGPPRLKVWEVDQDGFPSVFSHYKDEEK